MKFRFNLFVAFALATFAASIGVLGSVRADATGLSSAAKPQDDATWTYIGWPPTISSPDGTFTLVVRGRFQFDIAEYFHDDLGLLSTDFRRGSVGATPNSENDSARQLAGGGIFRRAQLGVDGKIAGDFTYRFILEFEDNGTGDALRINQFQVGYTGLAPFSFQIGAFSPPANLDDSTSFTDAMFVERATPAELARSLAGGKGRYGAGVRGNGERWFISLFATGGRITDAEQVDEQEGLVARLAARAFTGSDYNIHLGLNGSWVFNPPDQGVSAAVQFPIRFRDRPELRVDGTRLIDTGNIDADSAYSAGIELAANFGSVNLQAEHFWYGVDRRDGFIVGDPEFSGWYAEASYVLTGEIKRYNSSSAAYASPAPAQPLGVGNGIGAWEAAIRYSSTDLNFHEGALGAATPPGGIRGGEQSNWTIGINWYLNAHLKIMFDYSWIDVHRLNPAGPDNPEPFGPSPDTPPIGVEIGQSLQAIVFRTQFTF